MKYVYDREADSLAIVFAEGRRYRDSEEIHDGIVVDYDTAGRPIGIEFYDRASRFVDTDGLASGREVFIEHPDAFDRAGDVKGGWLRAWRLRLGFTQEQLANQLTVGKNTVARWEREELRIEHPGMLKLALEAIERAASTRGIEIAPGVRQIAKPRQSSKRGNRRIPRAATAGKFVVGAYATKTAGTEHGRSSPVGGRKTAGMPVKKR